VLTSELKNARKPNRKPSLSWSALQRTLDWPGQDCREVSVRVAILALIASAAFVSSGSNAATVYTYDTLGRLKQAAYDNGKEIDYTYDPAGNRTQVVTQTTPHLGASKPLKSRKTHRTR